MPQVVGTIGFMDLRQALAALEALGTAQMREQNTKHGAGDNQYGVRLGDIRKVAKEIKKNHELAIELWDTGIIEARLLAILIMKPRELSSDQLDELVRSVGFLQVADWLNAYVVKVHPDRETLRERWMADPDPMAARAGWNLTSLRVSKDADGLDLAGLLDRIEVEMAQAAQESQWTMNNTLAEIGIGHPDHRQRAMAIGESLGVYRDYPVSKGCTSPFAPIWIDEMVSRQG